MLSSRLILSGLCDAATNMAVDEAIFLSYKENVTPPTLRLYGWRPAAFSFGLSQEPQDVLDLDACRKNNIPFVRRPTGGGVIYHDHELTYSIVLSQSDIGVSYGVKESYEKITSFLIAAYGSLGAQARFARDARPRPQARSSIADLCFSRKEEYDIIINNKKVGGSAQKRRRRVILQHGSIPLSFDKNKPELFLKEPGQLKDADVISIQEIVGEKMGFDELSRVLVKAFVSHFKADLKDGCLTKEEQHLAGKLKDLKT